MHRYIFQAATEAGEFHDKVTPKAHLINDEEMEARFLLCTVVDSTLPVIVISANEIIHSFPTITPRLFGFLHALIPRSSPDQARDCQRSTGGLCP